jgi:hypothetical protein
MEIDPEILESLEMISKENKKFIIFNQELF